MLPVDGLAGGGLLLRTFVDRQLICTGPRVEQLPKSTFHLNPRALRLMAAVTCIRDYDSPRWCRVLWHREPSPVRCWPLDPVLRVGLFGGLGLARWAPSPTISGQFGRARPSGAELGGL